MSKENVGGKMSRRRFLKSAAATLAFGAVGLKAPVVLGQAKKFKGLTLNGATFQHMHANHIKEYLPEFEEATGMKVNLELPSFPIYNQRADLELSTKGRAWDFLNITFIYSGRWIGAGWFTNLEPFIKDPNLTEPDWEPGDFVSGAQSCLVDAKGNRYGFAWEAGAMIMAASRGDLIEKAGLKLPETFDDLTKVCEATNNKENVKAFVNDNLHHWHLVPYIMGFGAKIFKDPPENLTPTLDTPEVAQGAEYYANLLRKYSPDGVLSYTMDQAHTAMLQGRANIQTQSISWHVPLAKSEKSQVRETVRFGFMPAGPAGAFPCINSHGFGIPLGAKNKEAAWEFIKWALSKKMVRRLALEKGYSSVCRRSVISSPEFRKNITHKGQDIASLYLRVLELGGKTGYMKYRTVPVFPQVGDKINKALERIVTKQQSAADAMKQAQAEAIADLKKAGVKMDI